jgi:hypothetical protein
MGQGRLSVRVDEALLERLERRSDRAGENKSRLAERFIDEGLRMEEFPGVVFRSGPAGRRAALIDGPDVWEIVGDIKRAQSRGRDPIAVIRRNTDLRPDQIQLAAAYYDSYPSEIDAFLRANEEMHERAQRVLGAADRSG